MAALSFIGGMPSLGATSRAGRIAVVAWAIALAALGAAAAAAIFGPDGGARALVARETGAHAPVAPAEPAEPAPAANPASFRREAPPPSGRPRIAIVVRGLGLSESLTARAVKLPPDISLGLSAYSHGLQKQVDAARDAGHEVYLDVPVEPLGFPNNDSGPEALLTTLDAAANAERLAWSLGRATGYPGLVFAAASPLLDSAAAMAPLAADKAAHGLIFVHARGRGMEGVAAPQASGDIVIDAKPAPGEIDAALEQLEAAARKSGRAIGFANAYPVTVERLAAWSASLEERGFELVPVSALSISPAS